VRKFSNGILFIVLCSPAASVVACYSGETANRGHSNNEKKLTTGSYGELCL